MKQTLLTPALHAYAEQIALREHPTLAALRESTSELALVVMQSSPLQAQFLQFLIRLISAKRVLELGTFTGYSTLAMALALPEDGKLITCDINPNWTQYGLPFWHQAGQSHKIDLKLGPAIETLANMLASSPSEKFDFIFIDADKTRYLDYYEYALKLITQNGLIVIDNIFWDGRVIDALDKGAQTREIRRLNDILKQDTRIDLSLLPIGDGLCLIQWKKDLPCLNTLPGS